MALVVEVYRLTSLFPRQETFGLVSQLRRAAVSVPSDIAEGNARVGYDYARFLHMARGSLQEIETQLLIAIELGFVTRGDCAKAFRLAAETNRMAFSLARALRASAS